MLPRNLVHCLRVCGVAARLRRAQAQSIQATVHHGHERIRGELVELVERLPGGGPSVSLNIRGHAGGDQLPSDQLGALLGWIGGFAQPCREATPEAPNFTLAIELGESGEAPKLELGNRAELPGLAACIDASFAKAPPPPPPGSMMVDIVIPWGCSTLGPGFQPKTAEPVAPEPAEP